MCVWRIQFFQDLYVENHKELLREIKDLNERRDRSCSLVKKLNSIKMLILPQTDVQIQCDTNQNLSMNFSGDKNWEADSEIQMEM